MGTLYAMMSMQSGCTTGTRDVWPSQGAGSSECVRVHRHTTSEQSGEASAGASGQTLSDGLFKSQSNGKSDTTTSLFGERDLTGLKSLRASARSREMGAWGDASSERSVARFGARPGTAAAETGRGAQHVGAGGVPSADSIYGGASTSRAEQITPATSSTAS